jgi:nucleotide-binding universal stress UspA family protein
MHKILVPIDGSENANRALSFAIAMAKEQPAVELLIVNVQLPVGTGLVHQLAGASIMDRYYSSEASKILEPAREIARASGVKFSLQSAVGPIGETIADFTKQEDCDHVVMGTRGMGAIKNLVLGSAAYQVIHLTDIPVTVIK